MFKATDIKNIGLAYLEVLERKNKEAQEDSHDMDPTDHVKKNDETGKYCVYDKDGKKVKEFDDESDANEYAKQNHDALMGKGEDDNAVKEDASNDKSDDGEGLDKADPKAAKKKFKDRKDKDIDNDGDVDGSDKYLHKRRKAIGKSMDGEEEAFTMHKGMKVKNVPRSAGKDAKKDNADRRAAQRKRLGLDDDVNYSDEEMFTMIQEDNAEGFQWKDINITLSYHGIKPATILRILSTLKKVKSGKMKLKFKEGKCVKENAHTKGATPPEEIDSKDSGSAKKMRKDHEGEKHEYPGKDKQDGADAMKQSPMRSGDRNLGDKNPLKKKKEK
jgi:hypothetical protein